MKETIDRTDKPQEGNTDRKGVEVGNRLRTIALAHA